MFKPTIPTLKLFSVPIRLPLFGVDVSAARASLASVGRWNKYTLDACNSCFVPNKKPELVKSPIICSSSLSFASWFGVETIPNSGQVLKCQSGIRCESLLHQLFADVVVYPLLKTTFSPGEPAEQPAAVPAAFGLNVSSDPTKSVSDRLDLLTTPAFTRRSSSYIAPAKINANYLGRLTRWWCVNLNYKIDVIVTLPRFTQRCTGKVLTSEQCNLVAADGQLKVNTPTFKGHAYNLFRFHISKCADIQTDRSGSELVDLLNRLGITNHSPNSLTNVIGFQSRCFSNWLINLVVKLSRIPAVVTFGYCQYLVASISKSLQSFIDFWLILYRDYKFALYRQGLSHTSLITHPEGRRLKPLPCVPLRSKDAEFPTSEVFL